MTADELKEHVRYLAGRQGYSEKEILDALLRSHELLFEHLAEEKRQREQAELRRWQERNPGSSW